MKGKMHIGLCLFGLGGLDIDSSLRIAAQAGIRPVSLGLEAILRESGGLQAICDNPATLGRRMCDRLDSYGLKAVELFMCPIPWDGGVTPTETDTGRRRAALSLFAGITRFAAATGFQHVMGVPGSFTGQEGDWERAREMLQAMADIAASNGVGFTVEPHRGSLLEKPFLALEMVVQVPGLKYTLDYSHFHAQGIPEQDVYPLHAWTGHIHIKQTAFGIGKTLWQDGTIPYGAILRKLYDDGWEGVLSTEYIGKMPTPCNENVDTAHALLENPLVQNLLMAHSVAETLAQLG